MENLPQEIFFEEKIGTNGIKCLNYENNTPIKYMHENVVKEKDKVINHLESFYKGVCNDYETRLQVMQDKITLLEKENDNLSKGYDDWHNLYCKVKAQNKTMIDALIEVQSYQMQYVQLARTTPLYNIAEKGLNDIQKDCDHKTSLDIGYPRCLMCGKELPYKSERA